VVACLPSKQCHTKKKKKKDEETVIIIQEIDDEDLNMVRDCGDKITPRLNSMKTIGVRGRQSQWDFLA
jgi:hypothetical protein